MEAIGIQVNTEKLLHFDELLKVYRSSQPAYSSATTYFPLAFQLKIAEVEASSHKVSL